VKRQRDTASARSTPARERPIDPARDPPKYSVSQWSTPRNGVLNDIVQIARTGATGIGLWERKLEGASEAAVRDALAQHGLTATFCVPSIFTLLPSATSPSSEPRETKARVECICHGMKRLAKFDPVAIVVASGASGDPHTPAGPVDDVIDGLARVADAAAAIGLRVAFEFLAERRGGAVASLSHTIQIVEALGRDNLDIVVDVWHAWPEPDLHERLRDHAHRIAALQVNDVREPERTWCDRLLPGDGRGVAPAMVAALLEGGFSGWYELEVMSDDGTWGTTLPDSLWALPHEAMLARAKAAFDDSYRRATAMLAGRRHDAPGA
jgi:sugar phosphate isomerase/epimerase